MGFFDSSNKAWHVSFSWKPRFWKIAEYLENLFYEIEGETAAEGS